jgi:hypothetical protein
MLNPESIKSSFCASRPLRRAVIKNAKKQMLYLRGFVLDLLLNVSYFVLCNVSQKSSVTVHKTTIWVVLFTAFESLTPCCVKKNEEALLCFLFKSKGFGLVATTQSLGFVFGFATLLGQSRL